MIHTACNMMVSGITQIGSAQKHFRGKCLFCC